MTTTQIFNEYHRSILNFVFLRINNLQDAEDLTQEIFAKANRLLPTYSPKRGEVSTWLYKITTTAIIDYFRTNPQDKYKAVSDFVNENGDAAFQFEAPEKCDKILENKELSERLDKAFYNLKPEYRKVATMYFIHEQRYEEIADALDIKLGTVKGMLSRCREMLKTELKDLHKVQKELV